MRRSFTLVVLLFATFCQALAVGEKDRFSGTIKLEFGWVKDASGTVRSVKGLVLPLYGERIDAVPIKRSQLTGGSRTYNPLPAPRVVRFMNSFSQGITPKHGGIIPTGSSTTIYNADAGGGYGYIDPAEFDDPSSLDDHVLSAGSGLPWENLTFGANVADPHRVLLRWRCYTTYNGSAQAGVDAFSGEFADFGGYIAGSTFPAPGSWKLTVGVAPAGVVAPQNSIYVAQQFRVPSTPEDGEGAFDGSFRNIYNVLAEPSVGSSLNQFWFDWEPEDGIYTTNEVDILSGENSFSNFLHTITASGSVDTLLPISFTVVKGRNPTGSFFDLWFSDDTWVTLQPTLFAITGVPPLQMSFEGVAASTSAQSLKIHTECASLSGASTMRVYLYNFTTSQYELLVTKPAPGSDTVTEFTVTTNPSRFINGSDRHVRALLTYTPGVFSTASWRVRWDRLVWVVTR